MASFVNRYPHKQSKEEEKLKGRERERKRKDKRNLQSPKPTSNKFGFSIQPSRKENRENKLVKKLHIQVAFSE
jgi:hypothetical protein